MACSSLMVYLFTVVSVVLLLLTVMAIMEHFSHLLIYY